MLTEPQGVDPSRLFSTFDIASRHAVIAAVSGGSDSTALLLLLKDHLDRFAPHTRLVAVTVDHALRPDSAKEAAEVGALCARLRLPHRILTWTGDKPATGLAAAAREARHDLLARAARAEGTDLVFTGHTANDQVETVLMRQARADADRAGRGLAGIAPATLFQEQTWFVRPLLSTRREALREFLRDRQIGWIDDPTNLDERHERPRLRKKLGGKDGDTAVRETLKLAAATAARREALGRKAAQVISAHAERTALGLLRLTPEFFAAGERDAAIYALRILLAVVGGTPQLPDEARAAALFARVAAGEKGRSVLSRALIDRRKTGIFLLRETRSVPGRDEVRESTIWDGRYRIQAASASIESEPPAAPIGSPEAAPESLVRLAAAAQPLLPPSLEAIPVLAPWARYLPSFDIAPARAAAGLVGAGEIAVPPFREHIESEP